MRGGLPLPSLPCPPLFLPSSFLCSLLPLHLPSPLSSLPLEADAVDSWTQNISAIQPS